MNGQHASRDNTYSVPVDLRRVAKAPAQKGIIQIDEENEPSLGTVRSSPMPKQNPLVRLLLNNRGTKTQRRRIHSLG